MNNKQTCITNSEQFLNQMCECFTTIGLNLFKKFIINQLSNFKIHTAASSQSLILLDIVENEVACTVDNIETNSAPGSDGIPAKFIKKTKVVLAPVLTKLYNKCLKEECFPDDFKLRHVILIPETATPKELGDFRLISLLNIFSKIFEIPKNKMLNFINKNILLTSDQFGFTTNSSTEQAITTIYDKFPDNFNNKQYTCPIFLDIKKHLTQYRLSNFIKKVISLWLLR